MTIREKGLIFVEIDWVTESLKSHIEGFNEYCDASTNFLGSNRDSKHCSKENIQQYKEHRDWYNLHVQRLGFFDGIFRPAESLAVNTQKLLDKSFDRSENGSSADQFNTQIIYHQIRTPFKTIQLLLSFKIVQNDSDNMEEKLQQLSKEIQYKPKLFKEVLEDFNGILSKTAPELVSIRPIIAKLNNGLDRFLSEKSNGSVFENVENMINGLFKEWQNLANALDFVKFHIGVQASQGSGDIDPALSTQINRMLDLLKCSEMGIKLYRMCRDDSNKLTALHAQLDGFGVHLKKWKAYEENMYKAIVPLLKAIQDGSVWNQHFVANAYIPFINGVDYMAEQMQHQPFIGNDLEQIFKNTRQAIELIVRIFKQTAFLGDRSTVIKITEEIRRPIRHENPETQHKMEILDEIIVSNWILEICMEHHKAIKVAMFPFDQYKLKLCDLNGPLKRGELASEYVQRNILSNIELIDAEERRRNNSFSTEKDDVHFGTDYAFDNTSFPFYTWKHKDFKYEIRELLSGNDVFLHANVSTANIPHPNCNALKFNIVFLNLRTPNETRQSELLKTFSKYKVHMEMMGDQYYQCDRKIFFIPNKLTSLQFKYFAVDGVNGRINKLVRIPAQFSPYTRWRFRLLPHHSLMSEWQRFEDGRGNEFEDDEIDLELIGVGSFIQNVGYGRGVCNGYEVNKNYQLVGTINELQ